MKLSALLRLLERVLVTSERAWNRVLVIGLFLLLAKVLIDLLPHNRLG